MPKKTNDNQKEEVIRLLLEGNTQEEVSELTGLGVRTVRNIKKELTETNPELAQTLTENKYNRYIQKSEAKYYEKIEKEKELFEDIEEGWVYHLTAEELRHRESSKWWSFIVYPESATPRWKDSLRLLGCELAISPLHDKDLWTHDSPEVVDEETGEIIEEKGSRYKCGEKKKPHWHCIIKFEKTIKYKEANEIVRAYTNGPYLQKCMSLKGQYEYFTHMNNPEKYQYEKDEIERYNGFIIEATQADRIVIIDEIGREIEKKGFLDLGQVRKHYEGQYEYINVISLKAYYFEKLTQVNFRRKYPEGRTQNVRIVNKNKKVQKVEIVQKKKKKKGEDEYGTEF